MISSRTQKILPLIFALMLCLHSNKLFARTLDLSELSPEVQKNLITQIPDLNKTNFSLGHLDSGVRFLITQEKFDSAKAIETGPEQYKILVGKTKRISLIKALGMKNFSEQEVRKVFNISEKTPFEKDILIEAGERVRQYYREHAFLNAIVKLDFQTTSNTDILVTLKVEEGEQTLINTIDVDCQNSDLRNRLERKLRKNLNSPLTEVTMASIREAAKEIFSSERYLLSDLEGPEILMSRSDTRAALRFKVNKADQFDILYKGNSVFTNRVLDQSLDIENFFSTNPSIGPELATKIKNLYLSKGYARVQITTEEGPLEKAWKRFVKFDISEGARVKIQSVDFTGRFSQNQEVYKKLLLENASDLIQNGYYNRDDLDSAFKNFVIERQNQGYLRAKIISTRSTYNKTRDQVSIAVNFDEGPLTIVDKIDFDGIHAFTADELKAIMHLEIGRPLKLNQLEDALDRLKNFYRDSGFLEVNILNENEDIVRYHADNTLATLQLNISEGARVVVGSVLIEGNSLTKDYVIMKELDFQVDDILTPQKIEESVRRLQRLDHFSSVDIRTQEEKTLVSRRTVVVRVTDRTPGLFNTGIGISNERQLTLRGFLGVAYRNIEGTGRGFSARADVNYNLADIQYLERKATVGYLEPYIFNTRTKGQVNFTQSNLISPTNEVNGIETRQMAFSIEQDITSHVLLSFDLWNKATYRDYVLKTNLDQSRLEIASIGPTLEIDYRDHPFNPTRGAFTRLNIEYANPQLGSTDTIEYVRSSGSITHYVPITKTGSWVWANSIRLGYLKNLNTSDGGGVPWDKKGLLLGGQSSLRGFSPGEAFPNTNDFFMTTGIFQDPPILKTEARSYLFKSEIRFPIYNNFGGALFYDGGAVYVKDVDFRDPYRDVAGLAFRYATPVGAVSLEWGFKLDRHADRQENQIQFHFSIGTF